MPDKPIIDCIGKWSEIKLAIIREYAQAYSTVVRGQTKVRLRYIYIDAFAGTGIHESRETGEYVPGSPLNALRVEPPFDEYHFIDLDSRKVEALAEIAKQRSDVFVYEGDCNDLLKEILPKARYEDYRRALCILDPYGLHLNWEIIQQIGEMQSVDIFLNFPIVDMNRNVLRNFLEKTHESQIKRMNAFWGDDSWRKIAYKQQPSLFPEYPLEEKRTNEEIAEGFRTRLKEVAGFKYVPKPLPMHNSTNSVVYYLFFASPKQTGEKIAKDIFKKYSK